MVIICVPIESKMVSKDYFHTTEGIFQPVPVKRIEFVNFGGGYPSNQLHSGYFCGRDEWSLADFNPLQDIAIETILGGKK